MDSSIEFAQRLAALRKDKGFTRQYLAERVSVHVQQLKRYEAGSSRPTLDVIRNMATALSVGADELFFGRDQSGHTQRGPDEDLRLQFGAVSRFDPDGKQVIRGLPDGLILRHEARRWSSKTAFGNTGKEVIR